MRMFSLIAALFALLLSGCQQENVNGIYTVIHKSGIFSGNNEICESPYVRDSDNGICYEPFDAANQLGVLKLNNGDLKFAASLTFFNAHSCTINGIAKKDGTGWLYESHYDQDMNCSLRISRDQNNITFAVGEDALCRYYCGMRGDLDGTMFPLSSKTKDDVTEEEINCLTSNNDTCRKQAEATE